MRRSILVLRICFEYPIVDSNLHLTQHAAARWNSAVLHPLHFGEMQLRNHITS
jgi:hypothetical protein